MAALDSHAELMFAMEPTTYRELSFLAALVEQHWQDGCAEVIVKRLVAMAGIPHYPPQPTGGEAA